jgi:hypothetical protein
MLMIKQLHDVVMLTTVLSSHSIDEATEAICQRHDVDAELC